MGVMCIDASIQRYAQDLLLEDIELDTYDAAADLGLGAYCSDEAESGEGGDSG